MNCILRKFILRQLNKVLDTKKESVTKAKDAVDCWTARAKVILTFLENLSGKLSDNKIDDDELESIVNELKTTMENWK